MKFILIVLAIHLAAEWVAGKEKKEKQEDRLPAKKEMHPAEDQIR